MLVKGSRKGLEKFENDLEQAGLNSLVKITKGRDWGLRFARCASTRTIELVCAKAKSTGLEVEE